VAKAKQLEKIGPTESYLEGFLFSVLVGAITSILLFMMFGSLNGSLIGGVLIMIAFFCIGLPNKEIPTANVGVIYQWKERVFGKVTSEGWIWTFPWIYSLKPISVVEKPITIGEDRPFEILAVKSSTENGVDGFVLVPVTSQILVRVFIWDAPTSMNYDYQSVEKVIVKYVTSSARQVGAKTGVAEFVEDKKGVADKILLDFKTQNHESTEEDPRTYNQQIEDMGYRIKDIELVKAIPPKEYTDATMAQDIEMAQRVSERTNVETFIQLTKMVRDELKMDKSEAANRVQAMGKTLGLQVIMGPEKVIAVTNTNQIAAEGSHI